MRFAVVNRMYKHIGYVEGEDAESAAVTAGLNFQEDEEEVMAVIACEGREFTCRDFLIANSAGLDLKICPSCGSVSDENGNFVHKSFGGTH